MDKYSDNNSQNNSENNSDNTKVAAFSSREAIEEQAADWLAQLDGDTPPSAATMLALKQWIERSPVHRQTLHQLAAFWGQANVLTELSFPLYREDTAQPTPALLNWGKAGAFAAMVMVSVLLIINVGFIEGWRSPAKMGNGVYETRIGEQNTLTLMDGSVIELNTNSRIQVDYTDQRRVITLSRGEAHFSVSKNPDRPFEVMAGLGVVRAVGTAFAVHYQQQALEVTVTEGTVALGSFAPASLPQNKPPTAAAAAIPRLNAMVAGQRVTFKPLLAQSLPDAVESLEDDELEQSLAWRNGLMLFDGEPLTFVVQEMNRYTAVKIEIADATLASLAVGGQFRVGETEAMLKNLSVSFNIDIHRVNKNLVRLSRKNHTP